MAKKEIKSTSILEEFDFSENEIDIKDPVFIEACDVENEGLSVRIKNKEYILPSLSVRQYRHLAKQIEDFDKWNVEKQINFSLYVCFVCLKRNYNDLTIEWLEENLSPSKISKLIGYAMSGVKYEEVAEIEKKS